MTRHLSLPSSNTLQQQQSLQTQTIPITIEIEPSTTTRTTTTTNQPIKQTNNHIQQPNPTTTKSNTPKIQHTTTTTTIIIITMPNHPTQTLFSVSNFFQLGYVLPFFLWFTSPCTQSTCGNSTISFIINAITILFWFSSEIISAF